MSMVDRTLLRSGWSMIRTWNETHSEHCNHNGPSTQISLSKGRQAAILIPQVCFPPIDGAVSVPQLISGLGEELSNKEQKKIEDTTAYIRRKMGLTRSQEEAMFDMHLDDLKENKSTVMRRDNHTYILAPHAFDSPLFIDGTGTSDGETITHVSAVSTTSQVILLGLVLTPTENSETVSPLSKLLVGEDGSVEIGIISDEGRDIYTWGKMHTYAMCMASC